jgi:TMEM175 potassium channel family protein
VEDKGRLEAFSDGVFAVAATLLVLEFTVNHHSKIGLGEQLLDLWPAYLAYVTSFVTIGIIWINHHHTVSLLGRSDRTMLFINNLLLLTPRISTTASLPATRNRPCSRTPRRSS